MTTNKNYEVRTNDDGDIIKEYSNGEMTIFDRTYEITNRSVGTQQEVANWWAEGKLPIHKDCKLRTSTGNLVGQQHKDGSGILVHYITIAAVRTMNQHILCNTQDYAKGWAKCTYPDTSHCPHGKKYWLPLSSMDRKSVPDSKHIVDVLTGSRNPGRYSQAPDGFEYDRIVVFEQDERGAEYYRANSDDIDEEPLSRTEFDSLYAKINE